MNQETIFSGLESLLFVSGEPLSYARLGKALAVSEKEIVEAVSLLARRYQDNKESGLMLIFDDRSVELATKPEKASFVETLTKHTREENLSKAALEVLAIIAYRAPVSRAEIDAIRGVNCSFTLRNLLLRDLISREGNPSDSRGYLYRPTMKFLETLGIEQISALPEYEILSQDERLRLILEEEKVPTPDTPEKINE